MRRAEGIVNVDIRQIGKLLRKIVFGLPQLRIFFCRFVLYRFFLVKTQVLKQHTIAARQRLDLCLCLRTDTILSEDNLLP